MIKLLGWKIKKTILLLVLILLLGFFLRIVDVENNPKSIYGDGLTLVYDSYSILKTGHDQQGNFLPFIFKLGGSRPPGYVYATIPFAALFGPSALAANAVSILSGLGIIWLLFLLARRFFSERVGLLTALLGVVSMWDLSLSRGPFETHFALFLVLLGVVTFFKSQEQPRWILVSALSFGLSIITYATYALATPLLVLLILYFSGYLKRVKSNFTKFDLAANFIILTFILLSFFILHSDRGQSRFELINIFNKAETRSEIAQKIGSERGFDQLPPPLKLIFHNIGVEYATLIADNYLRNFSLSYLFLNGDTRPRHNPATMGELYWVDAILIILGIVWLAKKMMRKKLGLFLGWILISPLAASLIGPPHALRSSLMLPPLLILSAVGFNVILSQKFRFKIKLIGGLILFFLIEAAFFADRFYFVASTKFVGFWSYTAKYASLIAQKNQTNFDYIILSSRIDDMEFAYPVYQKLDPKEVIAQNQNRTDLLGYKFLKYNKVYIGSVPTERLKTFLDQIPGSYLYLGQIEEKNYIPANIVVNNPDLVPSMVVLGKGNNIQLPPEP